MKARPSITKRAREMGQAQSKRDKAAKRSQRKEARASSEPRTEDDEDPDIAGIVPGPQLLDPELFGATSLSDPQERAEQGKPRRPD